MQPSFEPMTQDVDPSCDLEIERSNNLAHRLASVEAALRWQGQQQDALTYGISHDLRAPLRSIEGFATLLKQHAGEALDETAQGYLHRIHDATMRMGGLLDSLHELSVATRAPLRQEAVDLSLLADWVGAELQDKEPARAADIAVSPGLQVNGDEHHLKLMLSKLFDNAWKFSRVRDRISISIEGDVVGGELHLRVSDQGIGFDMQYADKLFEPFQRLHGVDDGAGAGLGLAIAQCIAQRHGGKIRATSTLDSGSVFHIRLPLLKERHSAQDTEVHG